MNVFFDKLINMYNIGMTEQITSAFSMPLSDRPLISVVTAVYNRKEKLFELYQSLEKQTNKNFEWIVVDDGSTDGVGEMIKDLAPDFTLRFFKQENKGKHVAVNFAVNLIDTKLTFIVDSDDILTPDAIETIYRYYEKYPPTNELCGYSFLRCFPDEKINGKLFDEYELIASYIETRINKDDTNSDKAEVFFTERLREFPFPEISGEKFISESTVWIEMAKKYKMVHVNKVIYTGEYLPDGLTYRGRVKSVKSPVGRMIRAEKFMDADLKLKYRLKAAIEYVVYGKFAGISEKDIVRRTNHKISVVSMMPLGEVIYFSWRRKYAG